MTFRRLLPVVACAAIAMTTLGVVHPVFAQDATASVLAERAELDKALGTADIATRISMLEKFIADHPQSLLLDQAREALVRTHATVGEQGLKDGDPKAAAAAFTRALDAAGEKISDRLFNQVIWQMPVVVASAGFRSDAIELMKSFEPRFASDAPRLIRIGYFFVSIESPLDAVRVLQRAVEIAPEDNRAHNTLGTAYVLSLRLDDAANEFQKAIELEPKAEFAYASLANLKRAFGNPTEAIELYKKQLEIQPDDPETYGGLAISYLLNDDDQSAANALARALALSPGNFRLYTTLGYYYVSRGKFNKAKEMVDISLKYEPRFAWTHIVLGNILLGQKQYDEAIAAFNQAQSYGDFPTLHFELAKAYMVNDQFGEAIDQLGAAFDITDDGQFETRLGDVIDLRSSKLELLLDRERQAVLYMPIQPTTATQYRLAESLARIGHFMEMIPDPAATAAETTSAPAIDPLAGLVQQPLQALVRRVAFQEPAPAPAAEKQERIVTTDPTLRPGDAPLVFRPRNTGTRTAPPTTATSEPPTTTTPDATGDAGTPPATTPDGGEPAATTGEDPNATPVEPATPEPAVAAKPDPNGRTVDAAVAGQLLAAIDDFVGVDDGREAFRKMFIARQLAEKGVLLNHAKELAEQAVSAADAATELERSVRDLPTADREMRKVVMTARAEDTLGWVLLKRGEIDDAIAALTRGAEAVVKDSEASTRLWHLGLAKQEAGKNEEALEIYLRAYDPAAPSATIRRQIIETLYVKVHGSTDGLDQKLSSRPPSASNREP